MSSTLGAGSRFAVRLRLATLPGEPPAVDDFSWLANGLRCRIVGDEQPLARDIAAQLRHAGSIVECFPDLASVAAAPRAPGEQLLLILPDQPGDPDLLRAAAAPRSDGEDRFMVLGWGRRRRPRIEAADLVRMDADALPRRALFRALH